MSCFAQLAVINCCVILANMLTGQTDYFVIFIISVAYFLQTIVPNMFYTLVLHATFHYKQINLEIENVVRETQNIASSTAVYTAQEIRSKFFYLSERIDLITTCHGELTARIIKTNSLFSKQLLASSANFVGILIIEVSVAQKKDIFIALSLSKSISNAPQLNPVNLQYLYIFPQLQLFLSYLFIAESYQSGNPINALLMMSFYFYCGAIFMEVYLLSIVCWNAMSEVGLIHDTF